MSLASYLLSILAVVGEITDTIYLMVVKIRYQPLVVHLLHVQLVSYLTSNLFHHFQIRW